MWWGSQSACCNSQRHMPQLQKHRHQCQYAGCVSQVSVKAVDMWVCKAVAMAAILESGTNVEVRCKGWFGFFMHKAKYKLKFTGWLSFCIRNMWWAVNKFPFAAEHFKIAKLVILISHKQVGQEDHVKLWYISIFLWTWVHEMVYDIQADAYKLGLTATEWTSSTDECGYVLRSYYMVWINQ
jgi:hypothetical protein